MRSGWGHSNGLRTLDVKFFAESEEDTKEIKLLRDETKGREKYLKMLLQVHDELVFDVHNDELEMLKPVIKSAMENAFKLSIPLTVDLGEGDNWLEAH